MLKVFEAFLLSNGIFLNLIFLTQKKKKQVRTGMVSVSDGKSNPEPARLRLTMELLILQRLDTSTPTTSMGPPAESKVKLCCVIQLHNLFRRKKKPRTEKHVIN